MSIAAQVSRVEVRPRGSSLVADVAAGATQVTVADPTLFGAADRVQVGDDVRDYTSRTLSDAPPDVDGNPQQYATLTLSSGLSSALIMGTPVVLWSGDALTGQRLSDVVLWVDQFTPEAQPVPVIVPSAERDRWTRYEGIVDPPIPGTLSDDQQTFTADPGYQPLIDGTLIDPTTLPDTGSGSPTTAPTSSPTPQVYADAALGTLYVAWSSVPDFRTRVRLYVAAQPSDGSTPPADASTLFAEGVSSPVTVGTIQGMAPTPGAPYVVALQAYYLNADGTVLDGPLSDWVQGSPQQVSPLFIAAQAIVDKLQAATLNAVNLTSATGVFNQITAQNVSLIGGANSTLSGPMYAAQGVTTPPAPAVTLDWRSLACSTPYGRGLCDDGSRWLIVRGRAESSNTVYDVNKSTGQVTERTIYGGPTSACIPLGIVTSDTLAWVLYYNPASKDYGVATSTKSGSGFTPQSTTSGLLSLGYTVVAHPAMTYDGSVLQILGTATSGHFLSQSVSAAANPTVYAGSAFKVGEGLSANVPGVYFGLADFGSARVVVQTPGAVYVYRDWNTSTPTLVAGDAFPLAAADSQGLAWDGSVFHTSRVNGTVLDYTSNRSVSDYAITWRDDDTSGAGVAETKPSPRKTVTVNRQRVNVLLPSAPPDDGTPDGANTATIYAAAAGGTLTAQTDLTETQAKSGTAIQYVTAPTTTGRTAPTTSGFEGRPGGIGRYQSAAADGNGPLAQLNGDGSWRFESTHIGLRGDGSLQSIPNAQWTKLTIPTSAFANGAWSPSASVVTIPSDGIYTAEGEITWGNSTTGRRITRVETWTGTDPGVGNGTIVVNDERSPLAYFTTGAVTTGYVFAAGAKVRLIGYQTSGAALSTFTTGGTVPSLTLRKVSSS